LWGQLSVFAGSFELEAAEAVCDGEMSPDELLDMLSALVDKSILTRIERDGMVRFRLLETLRDYGLTQIRQSDRYAELRRRHADWYRRLVSAAAVDWFSPRQVQWMKRLEREGLNIREALEYGLAEDPEITLDIAGTVHPFGIARGALNETRRWLDRGLAATPSAPTTQRITALYGATMVTGLQGHLPAATAWVEEGRALVEQMTEPEAHAMINIADGFVALVSGEFDRASARFEDALRVVDAPALRVGAMLMLGWGLEFRGEVGPALIWQEKAFAIAQSHGESVFREYALWSLGIGWWRHGNPGRARQLLEEALQLTYVVDDPRQAAACLEGLAWIAAANDDSLKAATLMGVAETLGRAVGASTVVLPHLLNFHIDCERHARDVLGDEEFEGARQEGCSFTFDDAILYALGKPPSSPTELSQQVR
jgi:non-specific serine/threonine protein kinase